MIKKLFTLISFLWACQAAYAQNPQAFWLQFKKLYNADQYTTMYDLLAPSFKAEMSLKEHIAFFKDNIKKGAGKMNSAVLLQYGDEGNTFLLSFEKMQLEVLLVLDPKDKVLGWMWQPYKAIKTPTLSIRYDNPLKTKTDSTIDQEARRYIAQYPKARLSFAIVSPEKTDYYYYATDELPDAQSVYELGSITKTYIGWLVARAITEGKLNLATDIRQYLKGPYKNLERNGQPVLIKHLLNHSSGLPRLPEDYMSFIKDHDNPYEIYSNEDLLKSLQKSKLSAAPGTQSVYSNYGYGILGYLLEQVYQQPPEQLLNLKLQSVLQLDSIHFKPTPPLIQGYDERMEPVPAWTFKAMAGAGALKTTLKATAAFLQHQINEQDKAIKLSHTVIDTHIQPLIAYAWQVAPFKKQADTLVWHNGMTGGFSSFYGFFTQQKTGLVILSNVAQPTDAYANEILKSLQEQ